jgi:6-phospho-3-hexuloisomerase
MDIEQTYQALYKKVIAEHTEVFEKQDIPEMEAFMRQIRDAKRIFLMGVGREGIATRGFAMRLMHLGKESHWIWDDTTPNMGEGDLFIATNGSGEIGHIHFVVEQALKTGAKVAVVTGSPGGKTALIADCVMFVPACVYNGKDERAVDSILPMGSLFEEHLFMLFDLIIIMLAEQMNIEKHEMSSRHRNIE